MSTATDHRVLVIAPQWVGDAIVSIPLIESLAASYSSVDVLATPAVAAVYQCCPSVREVITQPFVHGQLQWSLRRQVAAEMKGRYQAAVILPNSMKSALIPWLAGIPLRRGMTGELRHLLLNDRRTPAKNPEGHRPSMLGHYLMLADQPIHPTSEESLGRYQPRLIHPLTPATFRDQRQWMILCPGAEYGPAKQWPAEHFAAVACSWLSKSEHHGVKIIGGPKDQSIAAEIESKIRAANAEPPEPGLASRVLNQAGRTSLLEAFGEIAKASLVISNDSGLMHAAAAFDIPVIGIYGSTDPKHTPPLSAKAQVATLELSCSPCFQRVCPLGTTACLRDLQPSQITAMIRNIPLASPS